MKIFSVHLSEDGLYGKCAISIKALDKLITELSNLSYYPVTISYYNGNSFIECKYSYDNLCKSLNARKEFYGKCMIYCKDSAVITIEELQIYK